MAATEGPSIDGNHGRDVGEGLGVGGQVPGADGGDVVLDEADENKEEGARKNLMGSAEEENYRQEKREGKDFFICNVCNHETKAAKTVKSHIVKKHRPKPSEDSEDEEEAKKMKDDKTVSESFLQQWDDSKVYTSTQVPAEDILARYDDSGNRLMSEATFAAICDDKDEGEKVGEVISPKTKLRKAEVNIENLERVIIEKNDTITELEKAGETKDDLNLMRMATISSFELEMTNKKAQIVKFQRIFSNMSAENEKLKSESNQGSGNTELKSKLKKANDELKSVKKALEEKNKVVEVLNAKLGEEMNNRAKAEAEAVRACKVIDNLQEILDMKRKDSAKVGDAVTLDNGSNRVQGGKGNIVQAVCRDHERPEGCRFGDMCKFFHDPSRETVKVFKTEDCVFWLEGACKYESKMCRNIHDPTKFGTKEKFRRQDLNAAKATNSSFLVTSLAGSGQASVGSVVGGQQITAGMLGGHSQLQQAPVGQVPQLVQQQHLGGVQGALGGQQLLLPVLQPGMVGSQVRMQGGQGVGQTGFQGYVNQASHLPPGMWANMSGVGPGQVVFLNRGQGQ